VVTTNLGPTAGLTVASALLVDYVLTVAVSMASAMSNIGSAVPFIAHHKVWFAVAAILLLMSANLRGIRESGTAFAIPTYAFMFGMFIVLVWGLFQIYVLGDPIRAESAGSRCTPSTATSGFALVFLVARSFSSGCAALTGVEAISNGVPAFRKPKSEERRDTLLMLGSIAVALLMGIIVLAEKLCRSSTTRDPVGGRAGRLPPEDPGGPAGAGRVRQLPSRVRAHHRRDRTDPGAGRQHRVQWFPGAGVDPGPGQLSRPASCTPAATGWRSPTASCSWRSLPSRSWSRSRPR
jgi:hypothetical protein